MRAGRAIRQPSWSQKRLGGVLGLLLLLAGTRTAAADVLVAPSADGHIGALFAAGPLPATGKLDVARLLPSRGARITGQVGSPSWSLADGGTGAFDLFKVFGKTASRGVLAGELVLPSAFTGWLLLSIDGAVTVHVDGRPVFVRDAAHVRGFGWDPVVLSLAGGTHTLVVELRRQGRPWNAELRLLDAADLGPPRGAALLLRGATDEDAERLAGNLADIQVSSGLVPFGFQPQVRVEFPRGAPIGTHVTPSLAVFSRGVPLSAASSLGELRPDPTVVPPKSVLLPAVALDGAPGPDRVQVRVGKSTRSLPLHADVVAASAVTRALTLRRRLEVSPPLKVSDPETVIATLEARVAELAVLENRGDASVAARAKRLEAFVDRVESGGDPLRDHGVLELARRSRIDGAPDPLRVHVPASLGADPSRRYPLVVVLHGYNGTPERIMNAFLGTESLAPHPRVDGFVLAPAAHGDAFYRGPGELEVLDAIDWAVKTYPIDPERISVAGHSMGGTGAAQMGLRYPDRFAAIGALAGYQSFFVRRDVLGRPIRPWELTELTRWSPASFAENGRDELLLVAQGTSDLPLAHSQSLAERFRALGYTFRETYPDIGHDVWRIVWANADMWPALSARRLATRPSHVAFKTDSLRYPSRAWVHVSAIGATPATVDATLAKDHVSVKTRGVDGLDLAVRSAGASGPMMVELDGQSFAAAERDPSSFHRAAGSWTVGPVPPPGALAKRAALEGPIRDAWNGPMAFVYGTLDSRQTSAAREVAEHFRARWSGDTRYPVLADRAVSADLASTHSLFLVGSRDSNLLVRKLDASLPLGMDGGAVRAGRARVTGDGELGFIAVYPNPENTGRYVVVVEAATAAGLWRSMSLPLALPDFIVFDSGLAPAAGQQVLGDARVLGGGYFDRSWTLPPSFGDVLVPGGVPRAPVPALPAPAAPSAPRTPSSAAGAPPASGGGTVQATAPRR
ncbi:MAG TPA: alpha/beta hydrolase-fold protein [Polyangiaceae bacterium]|jgi:hypothetical protein|nr:alpha/beta hydrolase-fold protein [Polyangiaceae bacterium]